MATTTLVSHEVKSGTGAKGPWTLNIFKGQDGQEYQTFDAALASQALSLVGQLVDISYEEVARGNFTNKVIQFVTASSETAAPTATPQTTVAASAVDDRQTMIMRQSALDRALTAFGIAGEDPLVHKDDVYELADEFIDYFTKGRTAVTEVEFVTAGPTV